MSDNVFVAFVEKYAPDPVRFVRDLWDVEPDLWQREVLEAYAAGERRLSIASGNGVGKTGVAAWIAVHALTTTLPLKVIITAPSGPQLFDAAYAEIVLWLKRLPQAVVDLFDIQSERIQLAGAPEEAFLSARTSRAETPEALAGVHAERGMVILIGDEASGIPESVFQAAAGSMAQANAMTLLLGNPLRTSGLFYETHHEMKHHWHTWTVSSEDCPRIPKEWIQEMEDRYGRESNAFRVQVLGLFPTADEDSVIPLEWILSARDRDIEVLGDTREVWGLDVGGGKLGGDRSALARRRGKVLVEPVRAFKGYEPMQLVGAIHALWESLPSTRRPVDINVDAIGMGGPVAERLRELGLPARSINVSESPSIAKVYANLRTELWFKCRAWFEGRDVRIPAEDRSLVTELSTVQMGKPTSGGLATIESKRSLRARLGRAGNRSPDLCDALVLSFASDATTAAGRGLGSNWNQTITRNVAYTP